MSHTYQVTKLRRIRKPLQALKTAQYQPWLMMREILPVPLHRKFCTLKRKEILHSFLFRICGYSGDWKMRSFVEESVEALETK